MFGNWCRKHDCILLDRYIRDDLSGVVGEECESSYGQGRIIAVEAPGE